MTELEYIKWNDPAEFYILDINGLMKFGVTSNMERRIHFYLKECGKDASINKIKTEIRKTYWEAEFIEQMIKWRLRPWAFEGKHEWIDAPIQIVLDCFYDTKKIIGHDLKEYRYIHTKGSERWGHYKQTADFLFK